MATDQLQLAHMVLDMDNLHFAEDFLNFLVQAVTDICADALRLFLHDSTRMFCTIMHGRNYIGRNSVWICAENGESQSRTYVRSVAYEAEPALLTALMIYGT